MVMQPQRPRVSKPPSAPHAGPAVQTQAWSAGRNLSPSAPGLRKPHASLPRSLPVPAGAVAGPRADGDNPVAVLLVELGLCRFVDAVLESGFDEIETLLEMEYADMLDAGMAPRDAGTLQRRLQEMRGEAGGGPQSPRLDESNAVVAFMRGAGLGQYAEVLVRNGFDDMETLAEAEDSDLKDLGLPRGHQVKLRIRLREFAEEGSADQREETDFGAGSFPLTAPRSQPSNSGRRQGTSSRSIPSAEQTEAAVLRSWELVQKLGVNNVGEMVKNSLFDLAPHLVELFPPEVRHKYREWTADEEFDETDIRKCSGLRKLFGKVVSAVGYAVSGFQDPLRMVPMLTSLGARHSTYGVTPEHWDLLGEALIRTLKLCLADAFTPEVEAAWTTVYRFVASVMKEGFQGFVASRTSSAGSMSSHEGNLGVSPQPPQVSSHETKGNDSPEMPKVWQHTAEADAGGGHEAIRDVQPLARRDLPSTCLPSASENVEECEPQGPRVAEAPSEDRAIGLISRSALASEARPEPVREEATGKAKAEPAEAPRQQVSFFTRIREAKAFWHSRA